MPVLPRLLLIPALWALLAAPAWAVPVPLRDPDVPTAADRPWLPFAAAACSLFPGGGQLLLGQPREAGIALGATVLPLLAADVLTQPMVFADLPDQRMPLLAVTAQEAWCVQIHMAFQEGRRQTGNAGFKQPLVQLSVSDLVMAPFQPAQLLDPNVWAAVGEMFLVGDLLDEFLPDPDGTDTPFVFTAQSAQLYGLTVPTAVGYGANAVGGAVLAAHAGIGEESLFRGVFQDEFESMWGPTGGLLAASALFGAAHIGGINQTSALKQFLDPGCAGLVLGHLYQSNGYDLRKSIAAHTYYDTLTFAISALRPTTVGNNLLGVQFQF